MHTSTRYRIKTNGYIQIKRIGSNRLVYEHIVVAETNLGRSLRADEIVHHLDMNRSNNKRSNLLVLLESQHVKLHTWMSKGAPIGKFRHAFIDEVMPYVQGRIRFTKEYLCVNCGNSITRSCSRKARFCSSACGHDFSRAKIDPVLLKRMIRKGVPWTRIGARLGVSDNGARKIARRLQFIS